MAKYTYPCIFEWDKKGKVWIVRFPDWIELMGGVTQGKTWQQAKYMAKDLLNLMCLVTEEDGVAFPSVNCLFTPDDKEVVCRYVEADTTKYAKEVEQYRKVGRYRMRERASWRYLYHKEPHSPKEDNVKTIC